MTTRDRRQVEAGKAVATALELMRAGDDKAAGAVLIHAVHAGVWPADIISAAIEQTGGTL